jgi:TonB family protein
LRSAQPSNTALQRTRSAPLRSPRSFETLGVSAYRVTLALVALAVAGGLACGSPDAKSKTLAEATEDFETRHPGVLRVGGDVEGPKVVRRVDPEFSESDRKKKRELSPIIVEAVITPGGEVIDPAIVSSGNEDLHPAVLAAIRQWKYEPARQKGRPIAVFLTVTVAF